MSRTILVLMALAGTVGATGAPVPKSLKKPNYLPISVGNRWEYHLSNASGHVMRAAEEIRTLEGKGPADELLWVSAWGEPGQDTAEASGRLRLTARGIEIAPKRGDEFAPFSPVFPVGLEPGVTWRDGDRVLTAGALEEVRVPAGVYTALPVVTEWSGKAKSRSTDWYASDVGKVKSEGTGYTWELTAFTPGK